MSLIVNKKEITNIKEFAEIEWTSITSVFSLTYIFARCVFTPLKIIGSFFLVLIFILGTAAFVPYYYSYGTTTILCLYLISSFVYGSILYSFRKSTLINNIKKTCLTKFDIYLSFFLIMFIFTAMVYLFIISFFIVGLALDTPLFMNDFFFETSGYGSGGSSINELNAQLMVWWYVAFSLLNFSLFYLFQNVVNTQKSFYLCVFFYLILLMMYGHALYIPTLGKSFVLAKQYSFFDKYSDYNFTNYLGGVDFDTFLLAPNINFPFNTSFYLEVNGMLATKAQGKRSIFIIINLLVPHYWINVYCANVMRSTSMFSETFSITAHGDWGKYSNIHNMVNKVGNQNYIYYYSKYSFTNAEIWSLKNETSWILAMYLWMAYFAIYYFMGTIISRIKRS